MREHLPQPEPLLIRVRTRHRHPARRRADEDQPKQTQPFHAGVAHPARASSVRWYSMSCGTVLIDAASSAAAIDSTHSP